jgi:hypothetical protein
MVKRTLTNETVKHERGVQSVACPTVFEAALSALSGEELPKWIAINETVFHSTDSNLEEIFKMSKY